MSNLSKNTNNKGILYLQQCFVLARTMNIKLHEAAIAVNELVSYMSPSSVDEDQRKWKYYLNLAGQYHSIDPIIKIRSFDDQSEINLSALAFEQHPYTKEQYKYGSRNYIDIVDQFPTQEPFLLNCLFPADIQTAVDSRNGTILSWDKTLVQDNEYTLIHDVQQFVYSFINRWYNPGYAIMHYLYVPMFYALLHNAVYMKIVSARLSRCHSAETHDFHIRMHLASYNWLDNNFEQLSNQQYHWLYRNIRYISKNAGHKETFDWLVENLFDQRKLPLADYTIKQSLSDQSNDLIPIIKRTPVNSIAASAQEFIDIAGSAEYTLDLAPQNSVWYTTTEEQINETKTKINRDLSDTILTKTLECRLDDNHNDIVTPLQETVWCHWIAYSLLGIYDYATEIVEPENETVVRMSSFDAVIVYLHILFKVQANTNIKHFQYITLNHIYLRNGTDNQRVIDRIGDTYISSKSVREQLDYLPIVTTYKSRADFLDHMLKVKIGMDNQIKSHTLHSDSEIGATLEAIYLNDKKTIHFKASDWPVDKVLSKYYLSLDGYTTEQYTKLADNILQEFILQDMTNINAMRSVQKAMVNIMLKLSSYSIQITSNADDSTSSYIQANIDRAKVIGDSKGDESEDSLVNDISVEVSSAINDYNTFVDGFHQSQTLNPRNYSELLSKTHCWISIDDDKQSISYKTVYVDLSSVFIEYSDSTVYRNEFRSDTQYYDTITKNTRDGYTVLVDPHNYGMHNSYDNQTTDTIVSSTADVSEVVVSDREAIVPISQMTTLVSIDNHNSSVDRYALEFFNASPQQRILAFYNDN